MEKNTLPMLILAVGLVIVSLFLVLNKTAPQALTMPTNTMKNTISVSGQAVEDVKPDEAYVYVRIETDANTADKAQEANKAIANKVLTALKQHVDKDDIETTEYRLFERREWQERKYVSLGYRQTNVMKVTTKKLENVGKLIDSAVSAGANKIDRVEFGLSREKREDIDAELLKKASLEAKNKAASIAKTLGVRLGKVTMVTESRVSYTPYLAKTFAMDEAMPMAGAEPTPIMPEEVEVRANINVVFNIG